jgi:ubiquinone biosynthesis protein COQ4
MIKIIRILWRLVQMARHPTDFQRTMNFRDILREYGYFEPCVQRMQKDVATQAIMRDRPILNWTEAELSKMRQLPADTLGRQYIGLLDSAGLDALSYERELTVTDTEYFLRRVSQTHDLWHVVLGYDTSALGEFAVNAFMMSQMEWPSFAFYLGGSMFKAMFSNPSEVPSIIQAVSEGWVKGKALPPFFGVRWEELLDQPLEAVRRQLGVAAIG